MYARVTTFHLKLDKRKEAIDIYQNKNSVVKEAKERKASKVLHFL
jgi:hypothetical protein